MQIKSLKLIILAAMLFFSLSCIGFGQDKLTPINITPPAKKLEKTIFAYSLKYFNGLGIEIGVVRTENEAIEKAIKEEIQACNCFKEFEILEIKDYTKEKLPKGTSVIFYDIQYRETTNPGIRTITNFLSLITIGIIPTGFNLEVNTEVKLIDKSGKELKSQLFKNQITMIGGLSILFVVPFRDENPFILSGITNNFLSSIANTGLIAASR
ncbi:hypothetical protein [Leptospira andrefontaineae]|uniref:Lipoprotein n=1 Tax=Leptospira andrefontaineae TaxID=2484976 RepID=A0A4R9H6N6_9LEPT|nr:hypothetical protein [Leptospira andrefontaineae]TGK41269.1 hypothetical protein EHO65_07530 [Leptospira andrefontaineae]